MYTIQGAPTAVKPRKTPSGRRPATARAVGALDRSAWLEAATDAIAEGGFGAARILALAKQLGVTRGSFYWHFRNHEDFVRALLLRWRDEQLRALARWRLDTGDPEADLRGAVHLLLKDMARDGKALRVELAVQDFARRHALAAAVTVEVDRSRMRQGRAMVAALTGDADRVYALTLLLYACMTGARLMLAASRHEAKTDAMAASLDGIVGEAIIASHNAHPRPARRRSSR